MNTLSDDERNLVHRQSDLFALLSSDPETNAGYFVRSFMKGPLAVSFDDGTWIHGSKSLDETYAQVKANLKKKATIQNGYSENILSWIGYMYRYIAITIKMASRVLYSYVPFIKMVSLYPSLHTTDPEKAKEIIVKTFGIKTPASEKERFLESYNRVHKSNNIK